jgi:small subunit ribosomal protein S8
MTMTDPIADMLTRIRNGLKAEMPSVRMPASRVKQAIADVLVAEGYLAGVRVEASGVRQEMVVDLKYHDGDAVIERLDRTSRPGRRHYAGTEDLPRVIGGYGVAIVSTSKGIMTDRAARKAGVGGEVLCTVC